MTDGPLKNLKLGSRWKRFIAAAQNDAVDGVERSALASDALMQDIVNDGTLALLIALDAYVRREQLDLDPLFSVEGIFRGHRKTSFLDTFQKELVFRLCQRVSLEVAISRALEASVSDQIEKVIRRIEDECIRIKELGEINQEQLNDIIKKSNATLTVLDKDEICEALRSGDRDAFKVAVSKKIGIDEGPKM